MSETLIVKTDFSTAGKTTSLKIYRITRPLGDKFAPEYDYIYREYVNGIETTMGYRANNIYDVLDWHNERFSEIVGKSED